jgi:hypothetical protein
VNFNPLIVHIGNATPVDPPLSRRSLFWAVALAFLIGIVAGRYSVGLN